MPRSPRPSSKAISTVVEDRSDPTLPVILEFQMPSTAITGTPVPRVARGVVWIIASMFGAILLAMGLIKVDRVVTAQGRVVSQSATLVLQPLEASIVRSIDVHEGQTVRAGEVLARLDPTFAAADVGALAAQVSSLQAQVSRLQAEAGGQPFNYSGIDPNLALQAAIFGQRQAEYTFKLENYTQKINGIVSGIARANSDAAGYRSRLEVATNVEKMRRDLERLQVGSKLNTLAAMDNRAEMDRNLHNAEETAASGQRDLAALVAERDGYVQSWHADISEKLADAVGKLSDARESLNKAQLRKQLVELRADRDRYGTDGGQGVSRFGAAVWPAVHHAGAGGCSTGDRVERLGTRRRLHQCRRPGVDQVRYLSVHSVRSRLRHGAHDQRRQLHRAG